MDLPSDIHFLISGLMERGNGDQLISVITTDYKQLFFFFLTLLLYLFSLYFLFPILNVPPGLLLSSLLI